MMSEMLQLIQAESDEHLSQLHQLLSEYVQLLYDTAKRDYGVSIDMDATLHLFTSSLEAFQPPGGRTYLARLKDDYVGMGCLKPISADIGEIKRMYVQSRQRRKGIGRAILDQLVSDARSIGYGKIRLDSPTAFSASHKLYESCGFRYIDTYPGSEGGEAQAELFVYMELSL